MSLYHYSSGRFYFPASTFVCMPVLWGFSWIVSLQQKKQKKIVAPHCFVNRATVTRARVDLLYIMAPGKTGFAAEVSLWSVAQVKCHNRCGGEEQSLNRTLERLNSPVSLPVRWGFFWRAALSHLSFRGPATPSQCGIIKRSGCMCVNVFVSTINNNQSPLFFVLAWIYGPEQIE